MNNLEIPPKVRLYLYLVFAVIGLGLGAAAVGFSTADVSQPTWLKVAQAVLNFVAAGFGYTAATHVNQPTPYGVPAGENGAVSVLGVIGIVLIIVALLGLLGVVSLSLTVCVILAIIGLLLLVLDWRGTLRR